MDATSIEVEVDDNKGMDTPKLHHVVESELPALQNWLKKYLPDSFKLYNAVTETLLGRWKGTTFCTLGWPDILAVGEGELNKDWGSYPYHAVPRATCVFAPHHDHLEMLLLWPGYLDWTQPIFFQETSGKSRATIEKIVRSKEGDCKVIPMVILEAKKEDVPLRPIPEGYELRDLNPDLHLDYILSIWINNRKNADLYIRELIRRFPSVGLFEKNGKFIGLEIGSEYGTMGILHVREDSRGHGLGKVITTQLAHKYFCDGLPVIVTVMTHNARSLGMHISCGFKDVGRSDWIFYSPDSIEMLMKRMGFKVASFP